MFPSLSQDIEVGEPHMAEPRPRLGLQPMPRPLAAPTSRSCAAAAARRASSPANAALSAFSRLNFSTWCWKRR